MNDRLTEAHLRELHKALALEPNQHRLRAPLSVLSRMIVDCCELSSIRSSVIDRTVAVLTSAGKDPHVKKVHSLPPPETSSFLPDLSEVIASIARSDSEFAALLKKMGDVESMGLHEYARAIATINAPSEAPISRADGGINRDLLQLYLRETFQARDAFEITDVRIISGGFSKLTILVTFAEHNQTLDKAILRIDRPAESNVLDTSVRSEYELLIALRENGVSVPKVYAFESTGNVLGGPFLVMEHVIGSPAGSIFDYPPPNAGLHTAIAHQLARIHSTPIEALGADIKGRHSSSREGVEEELRNIEAEWRRLGRYSALIERAFLLLRANSSVADGSRGLVHGDFGVHNLLADGNRITAVLDWELAHIGNPASDLGYYYYMAEHIGGWDRLLSAYEEAGGFLPTTDELNYFRLLGTLRLAVLIHKVDAGFGAGALPGLSYAEPGARFLVPQMLRLAETLKIYY